MIVILIMLLVVMGIWAIAWSMDSYASAQQAQATIEVARSAQAANLTSVLMVVFGLLVFLTIMAIAGWVFWRWKQKQGAKEEMQVYTPRLHRPKMAGQLPSGDVNQLVQLMTLKMLNDMMQQSQSAPMLNAPKETELNERFW